MKTVCLALCEFEKDSKKLLLSHTHTGRFPSELLLKSHKTGAEILFKPVRPGDPLWDEDGWDGEQCIYRPTQALNKVEYLVIHCAY